MARFYLTLRKKEATMKTLIVLILCFTFCFAKSQSLVGTWQVVKRTYCPEKELADASKPDQTMPKKELSSLPPSAPGLISFHADNSGEESMKRANRKKPGIRKFHYKYDGENIYILDKRSHLITRGFTVETLTADSLVYFTAGKECEKTFFVRAR